MPTKYTSRPLLKDWISAARLRTLPLSISCMILGAFLAYDFGIFRLGIFVLSLLTAVSLQILSNFSNDYGDSIHGADSDQRQGPNRAVQSGRISAMQMKGAMKLFVLLAVLFGTALVFIAFESLSLRLLFEALGLLCIWAAINYTAGDRPYGYRGWGDLSVFIFFGLVAVAGSFFLHTASWQWQILLPAAASGMLSVGVLNINNIRDIESDKSAGKLSLAVRLGRTLAIRYHVLLIVTALLLFGIYTYLEWREYTQLLFLIPVPLLCKNIFAVRTQTVASLLDPYLKQLALSSSLLHILFGLGQIL